ncbi:hypothetical protein [Nocardioides sp. LHG3406-4]|uniref:hypothetical protein n=1 Tax=Nocardioides sp. LHG3406-4 TaxID=2804575 RepID=UPI003CEAFE24
MEVLTAQLTAPVADSRRFDATITTTARQARTVAATLGNLIHVTDVELVPVRRLSAVVHESAG